MNREIQLGKHSISESNPCFIIAEAGVNHNGNVDMAIELVRKAKECGADCVKFQTFKAERVVSKTAPKAAYQMETTNPEESQLDMLRKLELKRQDYVSIIEACKSEGICFLSTPYSTEDIDFLDELGVSAYKVASGQTVEPFFLKYLAKKKKPIILSTGMCTLAEVDEAIRTIRATGNENVAVLQCTTNYPSASCDANLNAMVTMRNACNVLAGYSDHTTTSTACIAAIALGACIIERHFTLDKHLPGPDHSSSSDPGEFLKLVELIRETESVLGSGLKVPCESEERNIPGMRRGLVAAKDIKAGEEFTHENITAKRPLRGLPPKLLHQILGRKASTSIPAETPIDFEVIQ